MIIVTFTHTVGMQLCYAVGTSAKVVYYAYVYLLPINTEGYGHYTSWIWGAQALGQFVAGLLGQWLHDRDPNSLLMLNYISTFSVSASFLLVFALPNPTSHSRPFVVHPPYTNRSAVGVWIGIMCCSNLLQNHVQNIWFALQQNNNGSNGFAMASYTTLGALAGCLPRRWQEHRHNVLVTCCGLVASIWCIPYPTLSYIAFAMYGGFFYFIMPVLTNQIAQTTTAYALSLGHFMFWSSCCETLVSVLLESTVAPIRVWLISISVLQTLVALSVVLRGCCSSSPGPRDPKEERPLLRGCHRLVAR